jgi:hypothetical protein
MHVPVNPHIGLLHQWREIRDKAGIAWVSLEACVNATGMWAMVRNHHRGTLKWQSQVLGEPCAISLMKGERTFSRETLTDLVHTLDLSMIGEPRLTGHHGARLSGTGTHQLVIGP